MTTSATWEVLWAMCVCAKLLQLCLSLCDPMDCSPSDSSVHGILQARILEWVATPSSKGSSLFRECTCVSCLLRWQASLYHERCLGSPLDKAVVQSLSHVQLFVTLWTAGFPVLHFLLEFAQTHVHWISDGFQPSHSLSPLLLLPSVFLSSKVFSMSQLFVSGGQSTGASGSASVLPNQPIQG